MKKLDLYYKNHTVQQVRNDLFTKLCIALIVYGLVMAGITVLKNDITHAEYVEGYNVPVEENVIAENTSQQEEKDLLIGGEREYNQISYIVVHHTATRDDLTAEQMELSMRRTYIHNRGGKVIPTHFIIDKWGNLQRVNPLNKIVGATLNHVANIEGVHIELVGDFNKHQPTQYQYDTLNSLISRIEKEVGGRLQIKGHGDFQPKNCPGEHFDFSRVHNSKYAMVGDVMEFDQITAYYTPLPTDTIYSHDTYERSKKVNGDNVNAMGWDYKDEHQYMHGACGKRWDFGTVFDIEGWGKVICVDRGSAIDNNDFDIRYGKGEAALRNIQGGKVHPRGGKVTIASIP